MGEPDKQPDLDFDALLRSTAAETFGRDDINQVLLGDMAQSLARTSSLEALPQSVFLGDAIAPEFRDVSLGDVLGSIVVQQQTESSLPSGATQPVQSTLNVAQCMDIWARGVHINGINRQGQHRPVVMSGSVLPLCEDPQERQGAGKSATTSVRRGRKGSLADTRSNANNNDDSISIRRRSSTEKSEGNSRSRKNTKEDRRSIRNRESAAKSRKKRQEYTNELEQRVKLLKDTNKELRKKIICAAKAPPDPYAGTLDGKRLRRTRTMPL